jgi:simple sugar transport system ATP-binding protein
VDQLSVKNKLSSVSLRVHAGEIVGIAGVEGNGQSDLLDALLLTKEQRAHISGDMQIYKRTLLRAGRVCGQAANARSLGVGILPEDRQRQALLMEQPLSENFLLGFESTSLYQRLGVLKHQRLQTRSLAALEQFDVRPRNLQLRARQLSGGNQQKWVIARELQMHPRLIVAAHPTRGVDIGAIEFIHQELLKARARGAGVLLVSSELDETMALADRILVFYRGSIVAEYARHQFDEKTLGLAMGGAI